MRQRGVPLDELGGPDQLSLPGMEEAVGEKPDLGIASGSPRRELRRYAHTVLGGLFTFLTACHLPGKRLARTEAAATAGAQRWSKKTLGFAATVVFAAGALLVQVRALAATDSAAPAGGGEGGRQGFDSPVGIGALYGTSGGAPDYEFVVEGQSHFNQRLGEYGLRRYGEAESRLELGNSVGASLTALSGITLLGLSEEHPFVAPHLGIEPANGRIEVYSTSRRASYYEWMPMVSAGVQAAWRSCRFLPLLRAGGAAGDELRSGLAPALGTAYGAGAYVNCAGFDLAASATRLTGAGQTGDLGTVDLDYSFSPGGVKIGVRGETEHADANESRVLLLFRSRIMD